MTFADESATWTSAGALGLAALFLALGVFLFWRWRRAAAREIAAVQESTERTERLVGEIRTALADAQEEGRRVALLGELGSTLDLDAALRRALGAVSELTGADAAMIVLRQEEGEPITAAFGLSEKESSRELIGLPPDGGRARAVRLSYLYTPEEAANDEFRLSGGLAVPLLGESEEQIAESFRKASEAYINNPTALHLRAMNMLYEGLKEKGALMLVPSTAVESMGMGGLLGAAALRQSTLAGGADGK